jgi:hypothetical protein
MGKTSTKELMKDKFFAFLKATSLAPPDLDRDHIHLGHGYGRNCLLLGWSHQPFKEAIEAVREICPEVSEKTAGEVLSRSMIKLFHQHNIREDADPEADAPLLESILSTLDSSAVSEEVTNLLDLLKSQVKTWSVFVFVEGMRLKNLSELPLGIATLYPKSRGPLLRALQDVKSIKGLDKIPQGVEKNAAHCECYLTIDIEGEDRFANQQALLRAQDVVNVLNLYMASSRHRNSYQRISVIGQPTVAS